MPEWIGDTAILATQLLIFGLTFAVYQMTLRLHRLTRHIIDRDIEMRTEFLQQLIQATGGGTQADD